MSTGFDSLIVLGDQDIIKRQTIMSLGLTAVAVALLMSGCAVVDTNDAQLEPPVASLEPAPSEHETTAPITPVKIPTVPARNRIAILLSDDIPS